MPIIKPKHRKPTTPSRPVLDHRAILARRLDTMADCHLQQGLHAQAERLARQAADLRGAA